MAVGYDVAQLRLPQSSHTQDSGDTPPIGAGSTVDEMVMDDDGVACITEENVEPFLATTVSRT